MLPNSFSHLTLSKEGLQGVINLPEDDACVVHEMLRYLYTGDCKDNSGEVKHSHFTQMVFSVNINTIADKYNIPALAELADAKIAELVVMPGFVETTDFADGIEEMYTTGPQHKRNMQASVVRVASEHAHELYTKHWGKRFREVASNTPQFASQIVAMLAGVAAGDSQPDGIRVKIVLVGGSASFELHIQQHWTVERIKEQLEEHTGFPPVAQRLFYSGRSIAEKETGKELKLQDGSVIHVVPMLRGS